MSGVRIGERVLQVGLDDTALAGALAAKVGLSGNAAIVVSDEPAAEKARSAASKAGALVEVRVAPFDSLPFLDHSFDLVVINSMGRLLASMDYWVRETALREGHRVLRTGGRVLIVETGTRSGLAALLRPSSERDSHYERSGGAVAALRSAGFSPVRQLADREGYRFTEGLKSSP
jgi:ubiquinone/menaquinone biosynthesis C-methylase UbiE